MREFLFHYEPINPATWGYVASLMMIGLFFKFGRLWSLRNVDLIGLILFTPGLLVVAAGTRIALSDDPQNASRAYELGYIWLFSVAGFFLIRMLADAALVRRPLLEPNLSLGGMTFLCVALFAFISANVLSGRPDLGAVATRPAAQAGDISATRPARELTSFQRHGPGYPLLFRIPSISTQRYRSGSDARSDANGQSTVRGPTGRYEDYVVSIGAARLIAIAGQLAILLAMVTIGYVHFENYRTGMAAAALYCIMPYTAMNAGNVEHLVPAALLAVAIATYRRPLIAGFVLGLAGGAIYYPLFLLPLWISFYWRRGGIRFVAGFAAALGVLSALLAWVYWNSGGAETLAAQFAQMFGWVRPEFEYLEGFWALGFNDPAYRMPVLAAFVALAGSFALWPAQKNLGTLMSRTAALMLGTQLWHAHNGGLLMAWFLPLLLLTVFRPNLEDRVALSVLGVGWRRRHGPAGDVSRAA